MINVCVLMSTYNGSKYIKRQLETLFNQKNVQVSILIRDDGSADDTLQIIKEINSSKIELIEGNNLGFAESFWSLIKIENDYDYYAYCDQDDIWHEDKLYSAVKKIENYNMPALYTSDVIAVDENETAIKKNAFNVTKTLTYADSLIKSVLPGCTFVSNKALKQKLAKYNGFMISHDWTTYIIANITGCVVFDPVPHINYRLHGNNAIGIDSNYLEFKKKLRRFFFPKQKNTRSRVAENIFFYYSDEMSDEKKEITRIIFQCPKKNKISFSFLKIKEFRNMNFILMYLLRRI